MKFKRGFLIILALFLITSFVYAYGESSSSSGSGGSSGAPTSSSGSGGGGCGDSDSGLNYAVQGTSKYSDGKSYADYCKDEKILIEYSCGNSECTTTEVCPENRTVINYPTRLSVEYKTIFDVETIINGESQSITTIGFSKDVAAGTYKLQFKKNGYKTCEKEITIQEKNTAKIDVTLPLLNSSEGCSISVTTAVSEASGAGMLACTKNTTCKQVNTMKEYSCDYKCSNGACINKPGENETKTINKYYKTCTYVFDSSPYVNQEIKLIAGITDEVGSSDSDSVDFKVLDILTGTTREVDSFAIDKFMLDMKIISPSGDVGRGAVEVKIYSQGPKELKDMTLTIQAGQGAGMLTISNKNCVSGSFGSGGLPGVGKSSSSSESFFICTDGKEVQYCFFHKIYNDGGELTAVGCGCKSHPESLCPSSSGSGSSGGSGMIRLINDSGNAGGPGGTSNETPLFCDGCVLGNKCVFVGYRADGKYCNINSEFKVQREGNEKCENNFECNSNLCIDNNCISQGLWKRILNFFRRIFGAS